MLVDVSKSLVDVCASDVAVLDVAVLILELAESLLCCCCGCVVGGLMGMIELANNKLRG